ncbi:MAG: hypothetical protein WC333_05065 [Dehalococcoidia bacterium]|jgi:uncharacterized protein YggU (UPF0235/DUF167 family)
MSQCTIPVHVEGLETDHNEVMGVVGGYLRIKLVFERDDDEPGKGNDELISFLSGLLEIGKDKIAILQGENFRIKLLAIDGLEMKEVMERLKPHIKA